MKKLLIVFYITIFSFNAFSQEVLMDTSSEGVYGSPVKFGPNKTHYLHSFVGLGFAASPAEGKGADILYGSSHSLEFGYRYKIKFAEFLAMGLDLSYIYQAYHIKQTDEKTIPNPVIHDKEKFKLNNINSAVFFRINYDKRGNIIGKFIDLGAYGLFTYHVNRLYGDFSVNNAVSGGDYVVVSEKNLNYFENLNYGAFARFGFEKFVVFGKYRLSNMFTPDFKSYVSTAELPRLEIGIEMSLYSKE